MEEYPEDYYVGDFNPDDRHDVKTIKETARAFIRAVEEQCPDGRRKSAAFTHIEEAAMMAVKSLFSGA